MENDVGITKKTKLLEKKSKVGRSSCKDLFFHCTVIEIQICFNLFIVCLFFIFFYIPQNRVGSISHLQYELGKVLCDVGSCDGRVVAG